MKAPFPPPPPAKDPATDYVNTRFDEQREVHEPGFNRRQAANHTTPVPSEENRGEIRLLPDVLSNDRKDPASKGARCTDGQGFIAGLSNREPAIIRRVIEGKPLSGLAPKRDLNSSTMLNHKRRFADAIIYKT